MDVRRLMKRKPVGPKLLIWLAVATVAVLTVSRALSQPAAESSRRPANSEAQPLPAAEAPVTTSRRLHSSCALGSSASADFAWRPTRAPAGFW
jgi:hypothetical protein